MTKYSAFGTSLEMGNGALQVETATVAGTITTGGNATVTVTCTGLAGSPLAVSVAVALNDTASMVAKKMIAALEANTAISALFYAGGTGATVTLTRKAAVANIANLNIAIVDDTCDGLTTASTSVDTTAGGAAEVFTKIAAVTNISGLSLGLDTEDVTSHDSAGAWEDAIPTILRSGELSLDVTFDPVNGTQNSTSGLIFKSENKILTNFKLIFPDGAGTIWSFSGYVTGFEPSMPVDGALTGAVKIKVTGQPVLV